MPTNVLIMGLGPIGAGVARQLLARKNFKVVAAVDIDPGMLNDFYLLQIPTRGHEVVDVAGRRVWSTPDTASLVSPQQDFRMRHGADTEKLFLRVDRAALERQLDMNPGNKTSAMETLGRLDIDGKKGTSPHDKFDPGPIEGVDLTDLPPLPTDLPPLPDGAVPAAKDPQRPPDLNPDRGDVLPPLPERSLGLDL